MAYLIYMLAIPLLVIIGFILIKSRKLKLFKGQLFFNAVKVLLFISDALYYKPLKLYKQQVAYINLNEK